MDFMCFKVQGPGYEEQLITNLLTLEYQKDFGITSSSVQQSSFRDVNGCKVHALSKSSFPF